MCMGDQKSGIGLVLIAYSRVARWHKEVKDKMIWRKAICGAR